MKAIEKLNPSHQQFLEAFQGIATELARLNIMVVGTGGSGKSTLVDSVFRENLCTTGVSRYVESNLTKLEKDGFPLRIYLTPGLAAIEETSQEIKDGIARVIGSHHASSGDEDAIHCVWYCIDSTSPSVSDIEIEWIEQLAAQANYAGTELIVVLTKCAKEDSVGELRRRIEAKVLHAGGIVSVPARDRGESEAHGLETLISLTKEVLPESLRPTLLYVARGALKEKTKLAHKVVAGATAAAATAAVTPVPIADSVMLVPIQIGMISSIAVIFAVDLDKAKIRGFVSAVLGALGATVLGKTVFSAGMKLFPGVGQVLGGFINAGTAGIITSALGEVAIQIMTLIYKGEMDESIFTTRKGKTTIAQMFKDELNKMSAEGKKRGAKDKRPKLALPFRSKRNDD